MAAMIPANQGAGGTVLVCAECLKSYRVLVASWPHKVCESCLSKGAAINTSKRKAEAIAGMLISLGIGFKFSHHPDQPAGDQARIEVDASRRDLLAECLHLATERKGGI